jgi:hypothetical protein
VTSIRSRVVSYGGLIFAAVVLGFLTLSKGWNAFIAVPAWLVAMPLIFVTRIIIDKRVARAVALEWERRVALYQLISFAVFLVCLPVIGDDGDIGYSLPARVFSSAGAILFVGYTIALCRHFLMHPLPGFTGISDLFRWAPGGKPAQLSSARKVRNSSK